jgi:hypothetical protein
MSPYTKTTWVANVTPVTAVSMNNIENGIAAAAPSFGTSLPASPVDGQEAILVNSVTASSYQWRFRYNAGSSSAYKWEFVGGQPYVVPENTQRTGTAGWLYLGEGAINAPRAGIYVMDLMVGRVSQNSVPAGTIFAAGVGKTTDGGVSMSAQATISGLAASVYWRGVLTLAQGDSAVVWVYGSVANIQTDMRVMSMLPARVS